VSVGVIVRVSAGLPSRVVCVYRKRECSAPVKVSISLVSRRGECLAPVRVSVRLPRCECWDCQSKCWALVRMSGGFF